jgi:hypothetical protein
MSSTSPTTGDDPRDLQRDPHEERPMRQRPFTPTLFVFGGLFAVLGLLGLLGPRSIAGLDLALLASSTLIVLGGLLLIVTPMRRSRRSATGAGQRDGSSSATTSP